MTTAPAAPVLMRTTITSLPLVARGKVRDIYAVGEDRLLMIATDRISAFDVVMNEGIPGKGEVLTKMALFWFERLADIVPNHLTGDDPESVVAPNERDQVRGRSMLVKRLTPVPIEAVVRGYLAGSAWTEYQRSGSVCGVPLPPGLKQSSRLPQPIFTPATKAEAGAHDENIDFDQMSQLIGQPLARRISRIALRLYSSASEFALTKRLIIADTKLEFGLDANRRLTLMDEVLTSDSSRYWLLDQYAKGASPPSLDKQIVRDWLNCAMVGGSVWNKNPPAPWLPGEIIEKVSFNYGQAINRLARQ